MGRATQSKAAQVAYLKDRIQLTAHMVAAFDERSVSVEDLDRLLGLLDDLAIRIRRFRDDWRTHRTDDHT
ncbi:MAG: hypothetical protein LKI80_09925 [Sporolactobacillus sp.]|nr:hypothetical protein [Sporolactobacillus sp.]